jgi:hypothetical protein
MTLEALHSRKYLYNRGKKICSRKCMGVTLTTENKLG